MIQRYEVWGYRADAVVTCLCGGLALAMTTVGLWSLSSAALLMPYCPLFLIAAGAWISSIVWSFYLRARDGNFSHASGQMAIALGAGCLCVLSLLFRVGIAPTCSLTNTAAERVLHQLFDACRWWFRCWA